MLVGLLDADIIPYEFGGSLDEDGLPMPFPLVMARVDERLAKIRERSGVDEVQMFVTSDDKSNFRYDLATIQPYKGQRPKEKTKWWAAIKYQLIHNYGAKVTYGMEADDAISIAQWTNRDNPTFDTIILSRDKDLRNTPGLHYGWEAGNCKEKPVGEVTHLDATRNFYCQCLTGDSVDNILGISGIGAKSAHVKRVRDSDNELEMFTGVRELYQKHFGNYGDQFLLENGRLLWMLREEGVMWEFPNE